MADSEADRVVRTLALPAEAVPQVRHLATHDPAPVSLPADADADADAERTLTRLGLTPEDIAEMLAAKPSADRSPALWWLLERTLAALVAGIGTVGPLPPWPRCPAELGAEGRYLYAWTFLLCVPFTRDYHRDLGISDADSWAALACLGEQMGNHKARYGTGGLHTHDWLTHHFRGTVYPIGRLHFERLLINFDGSGSQGAPRPGAPALGLHIPTGRLTPDACDDAIGRAQRFFATHFPHERFEYATCSSWVLDPQLAEYLDPDTNIMRFQRRFTLLDDVGPDQNSTIVEFLFRRGIDELERLPRTTSLQRGVIDHITAGRTWHFRTGWFRLPGEPSPL
ncbi:acyltransferase domain-containing protein [Flindersiella endophytica]